MAYDAAQQRIVLFGGLDSTYLRDTWAWTGSYWSWQTSNGPTGRHSHAMTYDSQRQRVVLFGGFDGVTRSDTFEWDGTAWSTNPTSGPLYGRQEHAMAYDQNRQRVVLFGGQSSGVTLGTTWEYDGVVWAASSSQLAPLHRRNIGNGLVYDAHRAELVLFGGLDGLASSGLNDTWIHDGGWRPRDLQFIASPTSGTKYALSPHLSWHDSELLATLEGGHLATIRSAAEQNWIVQNFGPGDYWTGYNDEAVEGQWVWSSGEATTYTHWSVGEPSNLGAVEHFCHLLASAGGAWNDVPDNRYFRALLERHTAPVQVTTTLLPTNNAQPGMTRHGLAPAPGGVMVQFGGTTTAGPHFGTFELQAGSWVRQFSLFNPMPRADHALLFDPLRNNTLLFGGRNPAGTDLNDTWTYSGGQWTYCQSSSLPTQRHGHRVAFDSAAGLCLLLGGMNGAGVPMGDFWSWNGSNWIQLNPPLLPPARADHGFAYDTSRSRCVVYGGTNGISSLSDVWEWNGSAWANVTPTAPIAPSPGPRRSHSMAYSARSAQVVAAGGENSSGCLNDIWSWDGSRWSLHLPTGTPFGARQGAQMVVDPPTDRVLLHGGNCGTQFSSDLWLLDMPVPATWASYGAGCVGSQGVPQLSVANGFGPVVGQTMRTELIRAPAFGPFSVSYGILGFSRVTYLGHPIPFDLGAYGLGGCSTWTSAEMSFPMSLPSATGVVIWNLPLPNNSMLLGLELALQAFSFEVVNYIRWATVSNAVSARCGSY